MRTAEVPEQSNFLLHIEIADEPFDGLPLRTFARHPAPKCKAPVFQLTASPHQESVIFNGMQAPDCQHDERAGQAARLGGAYRLRMHRRSQVAQQNFPWVNARVLPQEVLPVEIRNGETELTVC